MAALWRLNLGRIRYGLAGGFEGLIGNGEIAQQEGQNHEQTTDGNSGDFSFLVWHGDSSPKPFKVLKGRSNNVGQKKNAHHYESQHELHAEAEDKSDPGCKPRTPRLP
jgi:hypothetical protein